MSFAKFDWHYSHYKSWEPDLNQSLENYHGAEYAAEKRQQRVELDASRQECEGGAVTFSIADILSLESFAARLKQPDADLRTEKVFRFLSKELQKKTLDLLAEDSEVGSGIAAGARPRPQRDYPKRSVPG